MTRCLCLLLLGIMTAGGAVAAPEKKKAPREEEETDAVKPRRKKAPTPPPRPSASPTPTPAPMPTVVTPLDPAELQNFDANPPAVRRLLETGLALTKQNLGYKFGSSDPAAGGMDCSGTIYHVLRAVGLDDVPRTASEQYVWARKADTFEPVVSRDPDSFELDKLEPGDLLFWTGTYATKNDPPVTHTMIYLGRLKEDGRPVMFGASDGRTYGGKKMWGVSAFDFRLPKPAEKGAAPGSVFIGYARIPGLKEGMTTAKPETASGQQAAPTATPKASPTPEKSPASKRHASKPKASKRQEADQ